MGTIAETNSKIKYNAGLDTNSENWINLHRNENLFIDESVIKNIVIKAVKDTSILKYPDPNTTRVRQRIAEYHGVPPENIFVGNGADEVLSSLFYLFRKRFEQINLPRICFKMYDTLAAKYDFMVNQFQNFPTLDSDSALTNAGLYIIDSPSSITGETMPQNTFPNLLSNPDNIIVWDNVHGDFCGENKCELQNNLIVIKHFSHYYGLASLRIGYCIASREIVNEMNTYREPFSVNGVAQAAAIECLNQKKYFDEVGKEIIECKTLFEKQLSELKFQISKSVVNFVLVKHETVQSELIYKALAAKKIATRFYGDDSFLENYLRIAIPPKKEMQSVIAALKDIINNQS